MSVDAVTGEAYLKLAERAKTEDVSRYFSEFCCDCVQQGFRKLSVILDKNTTHQQKRRNLLDAQLIELGIKEDIEIEFIYTPPYSPNFNLVEYLIHQLRLQLLHHQPVGMTIELVREKLEKYLQLHQLQSPQQILDTITHICSLVN